MMADDIDSENEAPTTSPYTARTVTLCIGPNRAKYFVSQAMVDQYPGLKTKLQERDNPNAPLMLREVDEDIGHTLTHYLYTSQYQTLALGSVPDEDRLETEFKRSVLAYCAARLCGIDKLEELTKEKIEELSRELTIFNLQTVAEEVHSKLPEEGDWFSVRMNKWIKTQLADDDTLLTNDHLVGVIGGCALFDKAVVKGLTELYGEQKAKNSAVDETNSPPEEQQEEEEEEEEPTAASTKSASGTAARERPDGVRANGIVAHHGKQNGLGVVTNDLDEAVAKTTTEEYSPMPSEEPSESPFEARRPSIGRNEHAPTQSKATDSDVEVQKPAKAKRSKKKKGRKSDGGPVRPTHDDDAQGE